MYSVTENGVLKTVECWSLMIPLHDNEGTPFGRGVVDNILNEILLNYPGFTVANSVGYWKGSDRTYVEPNYQVLIDSVPDDTGGSAKFFSSLKGELQARLRQEKVYVTKQESKQELLTFGEFFDEVGIVQSTEVKNDVAQVAKQIANRIDFVLQRLGYETSVLRRDRDRKKIVWERKICGIRLKSEFDDDLPSESRVIAADQFAELGEALERHEPLAIIGTHEFQLYILERHNRRCIVQAGNIPDSKKYRNPYCFSPTGEPLEIGRFVEEFTMSVFIGWLILRDEGFLPEEIKVSVGSDGSLQWTTNAERILLHSPAVIPDQEIQKEIISALRTAFHLYEGNAADPVAILQAKARNNYVLKRAIVRHTLKTIRHPEDAT